MGYLQFRKKIGALQDIGNTFDESSHVIFYLNVQQIKVKIMNKIVIKIDKMNDCIICFK